jgi:dTDP-4-amino-4,6-dideoxygalactose transaminase
MGACTNLLWSDSGLWPWLTSSDKVQGNQAKGQHDKAAKNNTIHKPTPHRSRDSAMTYNATALKASQEGLALPLYSHMTDEQLEMVCRQVENLLE